MLQLSRRVRLTAVALAVALVPLVSAAPADAVGAFGATVPLVAGACDTVDAVTSTTGVTRGAAGCIVSGASKIVLFTGSGRSWTRVVTRTPGRVLSVADDGSSTYVLYTTPTNTGYVGLLRRTHAGVTTVSRITDGSLTGPMFLTGSIVATGGRWWAVWGATGGADPVGHVYEARTMVSARAAHALVVGSEPALAIFSGTRVAMVSRTAGTGEGSSLRMSTSSTTGVFTHSVVTPPGWFANNPDVTGTGGVIRFSFMRQNVGTSTYPYTTFYSDRTTGRWTFTPLSGGAFPNGRTRIRATGTSVFVVWTAGRLGATNVRVAQRVAGRWTALSITDGTATSRAGAAGAASGKVVVVFRQSVPPQRIAVRSQ